MPAKKTPSKKKAVQKKTKVAAPNKVAAPKKKPAINSKMTKNMILSEIAESTSLTKVQVNSVIEELESVIERHIRKRAAGEFTLPGLLKIKAAKRPATKKRMGRNPATGEEMVIPAKPASTRVRVTALKKLKDMIT